MVWGSILKINDGIHTKLNKLEWNRKEGEFQLKSIIQYNQDVLRVNDQTVRTALAIDEYITNPLNLKKRSDDTYSLVPKTQVATRWAYIHITPTHIIVDRKNNRDFVREIIHNGLKLKQEEPEFLVLDTKKIAANNKNQWVRGFAERKGRINEGIVYGDGVEQDAVFGDELKNSKVNSVGITTPFFGNPTKVRVSSNGVVSVLGNHTYEKFIEYIETEILPYTI